MPAHRTPQTDRPALPALVPVLVPVLDLMAGQVVRGVGGQRSAYRPIVSRLCAGSEPLAHAQALLQLCAGPGGGGAMRLYVADLDAIRQGPAQLGALATLLHGLPALQELWLDAGFADAPAATALLQALRQAGCSPALCARVQPVFGTESLRSIQAWQQARSAFPQALLSLDRRGETLLDPAGCWAHPAMWPQRVIAMSLHRVGSAGGPDLQGFAALRAQRPELQWFGAGGLRDAGDLQAAGAHGAAGWLVASALHEGRWPTPPAAV